MPKKQDSKSDHKQDYQAKINQLEQALKRALADFENYRKRIETEQPQMASRAKVSILEHLLPVIDNFSRAVHHLPDGIKDDNWVMGILAINKQFEEFLAQQGLAKIAPQPGDEFDPSVHEAISHEQNESVEADHIIACVEQGYKANGHVLRPAKVRVSAGKSKNS